MVDRRQRAHRTDLGLPPRLGNRDGISQEDLAELIRYGAARVGEFERGEIANPGPGLLDAIAGALRMTGEERTFLWHLAAGTPPPTTAPHNVASGVDDQPLCRLIDGVYPHPAFLMDSGFGLLRYNAAVPQWLYDPAGQPQWKHTIPLWMFGSRHARHVFVDWGESVTPIMIARIRALHARLPADPALNTLIETLYHSSEWARRLWQKDTTVVGWPTTRVMRVPGHTDPAQPADERYHVTASTLFLPLPGEGDEPTLVIFQLPPGLPPPEVSSEQTCTACRRDRQSHAA